MTLVHSVPAAIVRHDRAGHASFDVAECHGDAWERLPEPRPRLIMEVHEPTGKVREYPLGPHAPRMRPQDLELMHQVWLDITSDPKYCGAHHYHIVALALEELRRELNSDLRAELLAKLLDEMHRDQSPVKDHEERPC